MTSVLSSHPRLLQLPDNSCKIKLNRAQYLGYSSAEFPFGGTLIYSQGQQSISFQGRVTHSRLVHVRAVSDDAEPSNSDDASDENESSQSENEEVSHVCLWICIV